MLWISSVFIIELLLLLHYNIQYVHTMCMTLVFEFSVHLHICCRVSEQEAQIDQNIQNMEIRNEP